MIDQLPESPNKLADPNIFRAQVDNFFSALPLFIQQCNAMATELNTKLASIQLLESRLDNEVKSLSNIQNNLLEVAKVSAMGQANIWSVDETYLKNTLVVSPINFQIYRCRLSSLGGEDPTINTTNWVLAFTKAITPIKFVYGNKQLETNYHHVIVQAAELTLPSANITDEVYVTNIKEYSISLTGFISGQTQTIQIPAQHTNFKLVWSGETWGWV